MKIPEWFKPGLNGVMLGAALAAVLGFTWGGWVTGGSARQMASDRSRSDVVAALAQVCVEQSKRDPQATTRIAELKTIASYSRAEFVMKSGWATIPGTPEPNRDVASSCADKLVG
ncbi:MAG: hypothetical protein JNK67_24570 [Alphaproteobacteria bacterium]|nr:hypothetical protein [Alphaproteobacteria bacterium]